MHKADAIRDLIATRDVARDHLRRVAEDFTSSTHDIERAMRDVSLAEQSLEAALADCKG